MITPEQQARIDAIKAKYGYKGPAQQQTQAQGDWFTRTAPKAPLPFDIANPDQKSARATATKTLKETGGEILEAGKAGLGKIKEGFTQAQNVKDPKNALEFVEGAGNFVKSGAKMAAGAIETATAPLAPVLKPVGTAIQKAGEFIEPGLGAAVDLARGRLPQKGTQEAIRRGLSDSPTTLAEEVLPDVANLSTTAGGVAGFKAPKPVLEKAGAATEKALDVTNKGVSKVKEVLPERPHPVDALRGYVDTKVKASMESDVDKLLRSTKSLARKTEEARKQGTDFKKILSDPQVYKGLKVKDNKIVPDEAISTIDDRIDTILTAKKGILPKVDQIVPKIPRDVLLQKAIDYAKGKMLGADEAEIIEHITKQLEAYPEYLKPSEIDRIRALARGSARNAAGQMKSKSEYAAIETAARDTVFDITDNLPVQNAAEYKALNDYVKQMIKVKDLLDSPAIRSQTVKGGRIGSYSGRVIGAIAGVPAGPLGSLASSYAGGVIADIITNNSLGSSFKMSLIQHMTDDPAILSQAQRLLKDIQAHEVPQLPPGKGNPTDKSVNVPIEMGPSPTVEPPAKEIRTHETAPPKVEGAIPETSAIIQKATEYQPEFQKTVDKIAEAGDWEVHHGPVKKEDRASEKLTGEGGVLRDANRSTIVVKSPAQLAAVQQAIESLFPVTRVKDKFNSSDYKSAIINVKTPAGHEAEIAVTTPNMWRAKMQLGGQEMYTALRPKLLNPKGMTPWEKALEKKMIKLYNDAALADSDALLD